VQSAGTSGPCVTTLAAHSHDGGVEGAGPAEVDWVVLLPVKAVATSKSRLEPAFPDRERLAAVVTAMRQDTVAAVRATGGVVGLVAAVDRFDSAHGLGPGVDTVVQQEPGLNAALRAADTYARTRWPHAGRIAIVGDLPALTPARRRGTPRRPSPCPPTSPRATTSTCRPIWPRPPPAPSARTPVPHWRSPRTSVARAPDVHLRTAQSLTCPTPS
jgi:Guanylyl transferase CofC like